MDRLIVERKLDALRQCLTRIETRRPATVDALVDDADAQDVLTLNLARAVQIAVDLATHVLAQFDVPRPNTMGEAFDRLQQAGVIDADLRTHMKKAVGFRNIAVHAYERIDWAVVFAIATRDLGNFTRYAQAITTYVRLDAGEPRGPAHG